MTAALVGKWGRPIRALQLRVSLVVFQLTFRICYPLHGLVAWWDVRRLDISYSEASWRRVGGERNSLISWRLGSCLFCHLIHQVDMWDWGWALRWSHTGNKLLRGELNRTLTHRKLTNLELHRDLIPNFSLLNCHHQNRLDKQLGYFLSRDLWGAGDFLPLRALCIECSHLNTSICVELISKFYAGLEDDPLRICLASRKDAESRQLDRFSFLTDNVTYIFGEGAPESVQDY